MNTYDIKCGSRAAAISRLEEFENAKKQGLYPCMKFTIENDRIWVADDDELNRKIKFWRDSIRFVKILSVCGGVPHTEYNKEESRLTFFVHNVGEYVRRLKKDFALKEQVSRTMWELA